MNTITRKIRLIIDDSKCDVKKSYQTLYDWNEKVFRSANYVATHQYIQENIKEFFYLQEEIKIKLSDSGKTEGGVFNTSRTNTTYRLLSDKFKGEIPTSILSATNNNVYKNIMSERKDYFAGKRSLRTYKRSMPIPIPFQLIRNLQVTDNGNYSFVINSIYFHTFFGADKSGNKIIMDRAIKGDYKLCDSSIKMEGKDIFLLAVFQFDSDKFSLLSDSIMEASLSPDFPIILNFQGKKIKIGDKEEYLHRRLAIQNSLKRQQIASRYNKNGKGRSKKMVAIERFRELEYNYINTRQHQYTRKIIDLCLQNKCGKLILKDQILKENQAKQDEMILRNWGYHGLKDKIAYKCKMVGIELIIE